MQAPERVAPPDDRQEGGEQLYKFLLMIGRSADYGQVFWAEISITNIAYD